MINNDVTGKLKQAVKVSDVKNESFYSAMTALMTITPKDILVGEYYSTAIVLLFRANITSSSIHTLTPPSFFFRRTLSS